MNTQTPLIAKARRHAVVIGGSMAGLLATRVLTEHFDHVTLVERDQFPPTPSPRKGVPQARHVHILLARGQQILEQLFPGLRADIEAAGAPTLDLTADTLSYGLGGWLTRFPSGLSIYTCSRDLLEYSVRRRLAANARVSFREACDVTGLLPDNKRPGVMGVTLRPRHQADAPDAGEIALPADFVVDAGGRGSRAYDWLSALGYPLPRETVINSFLGYASRWYQPPPGWAADWKLILLRGTPPATTRGGVIFPVEGGRWIVTVGGAGDDQPPTNEEGFLDFARSLPGGLIYEAIRHATPLSPISGYRRTENRLRHYEELARWPEGFVALGDAVCAFNPIYGQGMTAAAIGAVTLDTCLREQRRRDSGDEPRSVAQRFQHELARANKTPWLMATGEDFRIPETEGGKPDRMTRFLHWYMDRVMQRAANNPSLQRIFTEVSHLLRPPSALFQPAVLVQALK